MRLLDAAGQLLSSQGPHALSMRRLATEVGTSTTAVYSLYGGKPELLSALHQEAFRRFGERLAEVGSTDEPLADLIRLALAYRANALANPHLYEVMFGRPIPGLEPDECDQAESVNTMEPLLDAVRRLIAAGIFVDRPAEIIALGLWATAHGLVSLELNGAVPDGLDAGASYQAAIEAAARGWLRPTATEPTATEPTATEAVTPSATPRRTADRPRRRARAR